MKFIFLLIPFSFFYCNQAKSERICDINSKNFYKPLIFKNLTGNETPYCNFPQRINSTTTSSGTPGIGNSDTTSTVPTTPTLIASVASGNYSTPQSINFTSSNNTGTAKCTTTGIDPTNATPNWTASNIYPLSGLTIKCGLFVSGNVLGAIETFSYSYQPVKTGQTTVFVAGDDGASQIGVARSYTDNGDETVTDNFSGLVWQKCSRGLSGATCTGTGTGDTWANQISYCSGLTLAGKVWRSPSRIELQHLINSEVNNPSINIAPFPGTLTSQEYWSSSTNSISTMNGWSFSFNNSGANSTLKSNTNFFVRCVSGPQKSETQILVDNADDTITDKSTGLLWQKCSRGLTGATCTGSATLTNWTSAITYCSGLTLAGKTWRLPNILELSSIIDLSLASAPTINVTFFPATPPFPVWSSTTYSALTTVATHIDFSNGVVSGQTKTNSTNNRTRCVSGP